MDNRQYGFLNEYNNSVKVKMAKGQNIAGFPIGIIYIEDVWYPMVPGNIVNGYTFDFPVRLKAVEGLDVDRLFTCGEGVFGQILKACEQLQKEGVRAISAACGFFGNYQKQLTEVLDVPVAVSSLVQIPWIYSIIKPSQKIGVLTADASSLSNKLLENCGVYDLDRIVVGDLRHGEEFSCILEGRGEFDNGKVREEVVEAALSLVKKDEDIGAILLECSDMPPYAYAVQKAVKLPVFDFTTLIKWLHSSVVQKPYEGFI